MKDITEAKRYLSNAKEILREKAEKEDGFYKDRKYVKMAGRNAYAGVLLGLDRVLGNKDKRKTITWYEEQLSRHDEKILLAFLAAHDILHLSMSFDGNLSEVVSKEGLDLAEQIINWAEQRAVA